MKFFLKGKVFPKRKSFGNDCGKTLCGYFIFFFYIDVFQFMGFREGDERKITFLMALERKKNTARGYFR